MAWNIIPYDYQNFSQWKLTFCSFVTPVAFTHLSLFSLINAKSKLTKIMQIVTMVSCALIYGLIIAEMAFSLTLPWHILSPFLVIIWLGTLGTPILNNSVKPEKPNNNS